MSTPVRQWSAFPVVLLVAAQTAWAPLCTGACWSQSSDTGVSRWTVASMTGRSVAAAAQLCATHEKSRLARQRAGGGPEVPLDGQATCDHPHAAVTCPPIGSGTLVLVIAPPTPVVAIATLRVSRAPAAAGAYPPAGAIARPGPRGAVCIHPLRI